MPPKITLDEKKFRKKQRDRLRSKCKVAIGDCFEEWRQVAEQHDLKTDRDICRLLLDIYKDRYAIGASLFRPTSNVHQSTSARSYKSPKSLRLDEVCLPTTTENIMEHDSKCEDSVTDSNSSRDSLVYNTLPEITDLNSFYGISANKNTKAIIENPVPCTSHKVQHDKAVQTQAKTHNEGIYFKRKDKIVSKHTQTDIYTRDIGTNMPLPEKTIKTEQNDEPSGTVEKEEKILTVNKVKVEALGVSPPMTELYTYL